MTHTIKKTAAKRQVYDMSIVDDRGYNQGFKVTRVVHKRNQRRVNSIVRALGPITGSHHMLEIGCGTGEYAQLFAQNPHLHVVGTDICVPFIDEANAKYASANLSFAAVDLTNIDEVNRLYTPASFDSIVGNGILHHMYYELDRVLETLFMLTKPGGAFVFMEPNAYNPYIATIFNIPLGRKLAKLEPSEMAFTPNDIRQRLAQVGYDQIEVTFKDFLLPVTPEILMDPIITIGDVLERIPVVNMLAQSIFISARKPRT